MLAVQRWALWKSPWQVIAVVLSAELAVVAFGALTIVSDSVTAGDLLRFGLLAILSVVYHEVSRQVEHRRRLFADDDSSHMDASSVWMFAGALVLPTSLALAIAVVVSTHLWLRSWRAVQGIRVYRVVYSRAVLTLACIAVPASLRLAGLSGAAASAGPRAVIAVVLGILVYRAANAALVSTAIVASGAETTPAALFGSRSDNVFEFATLALGAITAVSLIRVPWFAVVVLPAVFLLQHHALINQLIEAATVDTKTALLNAAAWNQLAARELARAQRKGDAAAVLIVDMDHFKQINDIHGHLVGDDALHAVGEALADELRGYDAVGRFGGEEFVALLTEVNAHSAVRVAERVRERIESLHVDGGGRHATPPSLSASIGLALYPEHGAVLTELISAADGALYVAKDAGRNAVRVAPAPTAAPAMIT